MLRLFAVLAVLICVAAPVPARAEPAGKVYRIGYLTLWYSTSDPAQRLALSEGLRARGYREGQRIVFESRYAEGKIERLPELAGELVRRQVDVIVAVSTPRVWPPGTPPRPSPSWWRGAGTWSIPASSRTRTGRAAMSRASSFSGVSWR